MLANDSGKGCSEYAQGGKAKEAENEDGVEYDVYDGTCALDNHGVDGVPCGLKDALACDVYKDGEREEEADGYILGTHL